jgi:hypothetical protein
MLFALAAVLVASGRPVARATQPQPTTPAATPKPTREVTVHVRVSTAEDAPVPGVPVVADRTMLAAASPAPCAWTNDRGVATLVLRVSEEATRVRVGLASVAPGCGASPEVVDGIDAPANDWSARLDQLMKTNAFPAEVCVPVVADGARSSVRAEIRARPAVRVLARVKYLRDRVLFATPEREWAMNPMWQLFALAERVPTDRVILDGVPASFMADEPVRIRLTSNSGGVSRIVTIDPAVATAADLEGIQGRQVDLGEILIPQEIDRLPVNEHVTTDAGSLLVGKTISLTLASQQHPDLLFHVDVMGGTRQPPTGQRDQRAYLPAGTFAIAPTRVLRGAAGMFAFYDAVMNASSESESGFPTITVDPANGAAGTDLRFDESSARRAAESLLK